MKAVYQAISDIQLKCTRPIRESGMIFNQFIIKIGTDVNLKSTKLLVYTKIFTGSGPKSDLSLCSY